MQISETGELEHGDEALLRKVRDHILTHYKPAFDPQTAQLHYTTEEIYQKVFILYPNALFFQPSMVAEWLEQGGFKFFEYGDLNFEWMLNKA